MPLETNQTPFESDDRYQRNHTNASNETSQQRLNRLRREHGVPTTHEPQETGTSVSHYQYPGQFPPTGYFHYNQPLPESRYADSSIQRNSNTLAGSSYQYNPHHDTSQQLRERGPEWTQELARDRANYTHQQEEQRRLEDRAAAFPLPSGVG